MHTATKLSPRITTMIRMDHTHVLATFHKYRLDATPDKKHALAESISTALEIHARLEEEIFYPALRSVQPQVVDKSYPEHNEMRRLVAALRSGDPSTDEYDVTFMNLMRTVMHHVADEETILLPEAERVMPERLEELGWAMTKRRFELAGPRAGEIAVNTVRSYPGIFVTALALLAVGGYLAYRGSTRTSVPTPRLPSLPRLRASRAFSKRVDSLVKQPASRLLAYVR